MTEHNDIRGQANTWYVELYVEQRLDRWNEFESWLRADARHREEFKSLENDVPKLVLNFVFGSK